MSRCFANIGLVTFLFYIFNVARCLQPNPTETYANKQTLQSPDALILYWKHDNDEITFELHVKDTSRWVLFGVTNSSVSDVVVAYWLNDEGVGHFSDRRITSDGAVVDTQQNWFPVDALVSGEHSIFKFKRHIKLECSGNVDGEDLDIATGTNEIVYMTGISDSASNSSLSSLKIQLLSSSGPFGCKAKSAATQFTSKPTGVYTYFDDLVPGGNYRLYWNYTSTDFIGEIHCRTLGWVGLGLSPAGGMEQADMIVGWISNGVPNFTDRFATGKTPPTIDKNQDWKLLSYAESNGYTILKFQRPLKLCDPDDRIIEVYNFLANSCADKLIWGVSSRLKSIDSATRPQTKEYTKEFLKDRLKKF